jgi:ankyrin repeat protein
MSSSFPDRVDLDQVRRQAKELRDAARAGDRAAAERIARWHAPSAEPGPVTLAIAQLVIARELGFASWPRLKAAVETQAGLRDRAVAFASASVEGQTRHARRLLEDDPQLVRVDIRAAATVGDVRWVERLLATDPSLAHTVDGERAWPPLLYVCYSHWHRIEPARAPGMVEVVRLLLDAGVSPDTNNGARPHHGYRSALHGSVTANNPQVTRLLLERGADRNDGESLYHAAEHRDRECLGLLLASGATVAGTWAVDVAVGANDADTVRLLLDTATRQTPEHVPALVTDLLAGRSDTASAPVVEALLKAGADPTRLDPNGLSPLRQAVRAGNERTAIALRRHGAPEDTTDIDRFLGACARGDGATAKRLLTDQPDLRDRLSDRDRAAIVDVAGSGTAGAVRLMLELGFSPRARNSFGETPLHAAAAAGNADTIRLVLDAGAELDARDANFQGTPLGFATVSSGEQRGTRPDWVETVRLLLDAGADPTGVWVPSSPPSEDVADVLQTHGITPTAASRDSAARAYGKHT